MTPQLTLAPLQGLTDALFREVFFRWFGGFDEAMAPYISVNAHNVLRKQRLSHILQQEKCPVPVIPQILTNDAEAVVAFSRLVAELGIPSMNLNMGCPYPVVTKKKKGAGMLQDVAYLRKFFDIVFSSVAVPLGVKLRLGLKDKQEVLQVIAVLNDYPVQEVVIHPRIGTQYYSGKPDLVMFSKCLDQLQPPVVYNGDIFTAEDYKNVLRQFPAVSKVMIGRGILRDPFLAMRLRNQLVSEAVLESIYGFQQDLFEAMRMRKKNPNQFPQGMKEYWWYLSQSFEHPAAVFQQVKRVQTVKEYEQVVAMIFQQQKIRF